MKFIPKPHQAYYNDNGEEIPSVTTLLKLLNTNLDGWANYMGLKGIDSRKYTEERALYGSYVHEICEEFFRGNIPENIVQTYDIDTSLLSRSQFEILCYKLNIVKQLFHNQGYEFWDIELSLHTDTFGGTIDLILYNKENNDFILVDFKTSKSVYPKYFTQLAGYTILMSKCKSANIKAVCVVLIDKEVTDTSFINIRQFSANEYNISIFTDILNIYYTLTEKDRRSYIGTSV